MIKLYYRTIIYFIFLSNTLVSQHIEWLHEFDNNYRFSYVAGTDVVGNVYVTGSHYVSPKGVFLFKYNRLGTLVDSDTSSSVYYGGGVSWATTDYNGNTYVVGVVAGDITFGSYTLSNTSGSLETFLVKYDSTLNVVWARKFDRSTPRNVMLDKWGNIYVSGNCNNIAIDGFNLDQGFLARFDSLGNCTMAFSSPESVIWSALDGFGNCFTMNYSGTSSCCIKKYNFSGMFLWTMPSLGSIVVGDKFGNCYKYGGASISRLDSTGYCNWTFHGYGEVGYGMDIDTLGNVYTMGMSISHSIIVGKFDASGVYHFIDSIPKTEDYRYDPSSIKIDNRGNIYVSGNTYEENERGFIAKISETGVVGINSPSFPSSFTIYPNPASNTVTIKEAGLGNSVLKINNVFGQIVYELKLNTNHSEEKINLSSYSKGIYFVELISEKRHEVKRLIVN